MTMFSFYHSIYKVICQKAVNGWRFEIFNGADSLCCCGGFGDYQDCEQTAKEYVGHVEAGTLF